MTTFIDGKTGDRIEVHYNGGDNASSFPRVQVKYPDTPLTVNVGHNHVEWGTDAYGMNGADVELSPEGGFVARFQESSRHMVMDHEGFRVYDADSPLDDRLILDLNHDAFHNGDNPTMGKVLQDQVYNDMIERAADIVSEHGENPEFDRGVYNLIAEMFGKMDVYTSDRIDEIEAEVRAIKPISI